MPLNFKRERGFSRELCLAHMRTLFRIYSPIVATVVGSNHSEFICPTCPDPEWSCTVQRLSVTGAVYECDIFAVSLVQTENEPHLHGTILLTHRPAQVFE